jgi:toxin ParE1/3/4
VEGSAIFPLGGRVVPELRRPDIRELFVYSYRIVYRIHNDAVTILTIYHGARASIDQTLGSRLS